MYVYARPSIHSLYFIDSRRVYESKNYPTVEVNLYSGKIYVRTHVKLRDSRNPPYGTIDDKIVETMSSNGPHPFPLLIICGRGGEGKALLFLFFKLAKRQRGPLGQSVSTIKFCRRLF